MITTELIKQLRDKTAVSVMQCKKALEEAGGDMEKATIILLKRSAEVAVKKEGRELGAGAVQSYIHNTGMIGAMVILSSETDFVSQNEEFKALARDIAMHVTASDPENLSTLLEQPFIKNPEVTIQNLIDQAIQKFGEKIVLAQFVRYSVK